MSLADLREGVENFLAGLEEDRYQADVRRHEGAHPWRRYARETHLFSRGRVAEIQRALAESSGDEERRLRDLLAFIALGQGYREAAMLMEERFEWEASGVVTGPEFEYAPREVPQALAATSEPDRRRAIEFAFQRARQERRIVAEESVARFRGAVGELGHGGHVEALEVLRGFDLRAIARDGERFLAETDGIYRDLLRWHLPRLTGTEPGEATAGDGFRLRRAAPLEDVLRGGTAYRQVLDWIAETGLDPLAEGRIDVEWDVGLAGESAICRTPRVPQRVRLAVDAGAGRAAWATYLEALGFALHRAHTDPTLGVEERRLGDRTVPVASGLLFGSLLRNPSFVGRLFRLSHADSRDVLRTEALIALFGIRHDIGLLRFDLAYFGGATDDNVYAEALTEATGLRHAPASGPWEVEVEFSAALRLRAAQLAAIHGTILRNRFDEDWFRNPAAGGYLRDLFANGQRYPAGELAAQLGYAKLDFEPWLSFLRELVD